MYIIRFVRRGAQQYTCKSLWRNLLLKNDGLILFEDDESHAVTMNDELIVIVMQSMGIM